MSNIKFYRELFLMGTRQEKKLICKLVIFNLTQKVLVEHDFGLPIEKAKGESVHMIVIVFV